MDPYSDIPQTPPSDQPSEARPLMPLGAIIWIPLSVVITAGVVFAAKFGHSQAQAELDSRPNPSGENETYSPAFLVEPGDEPLVFASSQKALRDHLSAPPGSAGSGTILQDQPITLRVIRSDQDFAYVIVVAGRYQGMRFWTRAERLGR